MFWRDVEGAHLPNGVSFESSYEEVKSAFAEPIEATDSRLRFRTEQGYTAEFMFIADESASDKRKLVDIKISCPTSGNPGTSPYFFGL